MEVCATVGPLPAKYGSNFNNPLILCPIAHQYPSIFESRQSFSSSLKCHCIKNEIADKQTESGEKKQGFSVLSSDVAWERGSIWSTMAMYMFSLHIPLGVGGLSIVAYALDQPVLDLQTEALSLLVLQMLEFIGTVLLLRSAAKSEPKIVSFFKASKVMKERNWLYASVIGFGFLVWTVFLTSLLADRLVGTNAVNNPVLKEILQSGNVAKVACVLVYSLVTPLLEEIVYRGFLLTALCSTMPWHNAVFLSSAVFSAAHFSGENFIQLFIIGCVLGCCYCWAGNLSSSIVVHSLYNAVTLIITFMS